LQRAIAFLSDARALRRYNAVLRIATTHGISANIEPFVQSNIPRRTDAPVFFERFSGLQYQKRIYEAVVNGTADLGITSYPPAIAPPFVMRHLRPHPLAMAFNPAYRNIPSGYARIAELVRDDNKLKIAIHRKTHAHPLTIQIVTYLRRQGANLGPSQFVETDDTEQIKELIFSSPNVVGILPELFLRRESWDYKVVFRPLDPPLPYWKWGAVYRSHSPNRALNMFLAIMSPYFVDRSNPKEKRRSRARC
jgi:DNA-binding transcriptional LysR family regulator